MIGEEVQRALYQALTPVVPDARVYDRVPIGASLPYVTIGDEQVVDDGNTCDNGWEVFSDVHIWSRANGGFQEAKLLVATIVPAIVGITSIDGHHLISVEVENTRIFRDPDGLTSHGVISVKFIINPA